jgi:Sec7-like guanine-nucleotide exchange factor
VDQNIKNVNIAIDSALNSTNVGKALEGKVANYIRNNIKEVTGFGQQVTRTVEKNIAGDLDVVTADAIIEVKKSIGAVSFDQICKYADPSHVDFMNNLNKKVVLYIDEAIDMTNSNNLKLINDIKAKGVSVVINSLEGLKGVLN